MPKGLAKVSSRFRTPYVTITLFSSIACALLAVNLALPGGELIGLITSIYNFGALVAYMYVNAAAVALRFKDPDRKGWMMPLNFGVTRNGQRYRVSLVPIIGLASAAVVWIVLVGLHPVGRIIGTAWFVVGIAGYLIYQKYGGARKKDA